MRLSAEKVGDNPKAGVLVVPVVSIICLIVMGCGSVPAAIVSDGGLDADSDTDSDTDTDTDSDTDQAPDSSAKDDASVDELPPWEWIDNPEGEFCGDECEQLTFAYHVAEQEWDVWEGYLVFRDDTGAVNVVDVEAGKSMRIPDVYPEYSIETGVSTTSWPTIYKNSIYYALSIYGADPPRREIIHADFKAQTQELVWRREEAKDLFYCMPESLDVYGERLVSKCGAGDPEVRTLSAFEPPWPSTGEVLIEESYGGYNSIWENVAVFWDDREDPSNISGYDFDTGEFVSIISDAQYQYAPRIQGRRVVYMDFREGKSNPWGSWAGAKVVVYDLDKATRFPLTGGNWIAAHPDIYEDVAVWMDYRGCGSQKKGNLACVEIWGFNLETLTRFQITYLEGRPKTYPRIWKNKVFMHMFAEDYSTDAIYMVALPEEGRGDS
ncbi:MAG: hypothetical protein GY854_30815 [Deltaproteobacteria bacterium]|nr:hypothetical protein [Deltaproteobacteria bacterium]